MAWRVAIAVAFVAGEVVLLATDGGPEQEPWDAVLLIGMPFTAGLLIGRSWAVALALLLGPLYLIDLRSGSGDDELVGWYVIALFTAINAVPLALGVGTNRLVARNAGEAVDPRDG